jgi:mycothiol synthase
MATGSPPPPAGVRVAASGPLTPGEAAAALAVVQHAADEDGVSPLSEHVLLHLRYGGDPRARNILVWHNGKLAGYGHLDPTDLVEGPAAEMVIDPDSRRQGLGLILGQALAAEAGAGGMRLWAHGELPAAASLAAATGLHRARALWQMRRSLQTLIDKPQLAEGLDVRTFVPGQDEDAWVKLNQRAFARHPEQGAWTRADLELREREPWFDPAGFFLAERDGHLAGFHWTKIHGGTGAGPRGTADADKADPYKADPDKADPDKLAAHGHEPIGEVYVVGVDPDERGSGLGRALTLIGLRYLRARGLSQVMLYVDETNTAAIRLYETLGFTHWDTDVMYSSQPSDRPAA